jgi:uncharacterized protein YbjT (DUF2867 family)
MKILLAGAGGQVGRRLAAILNARGHDVRGITGLDLTVANSCANLADGVDTVVSCLGASVSFSHKDRRGFTEIDPIANGNLLREAERARVRRFVYLSVHLEEGYRRTAYIEAHESFVRELRQSRLTHTVVRPTGIHSAFADLLPFARRGMLPLMGGGTARTNPIDPLDVAEIMAAHLADGPLDVPCGGPEILTRREINSVLAASVGRDVWMPELPRWLVAAESKLFGLPHPRAGQLLEFFNAVARVDCVAPALGTRRLQDFYPKR